MSAAPILTLMKDGEVVKSLSVEDEALVGRGEGCVIRLDDRAISRQHAVFKRTKDGMQVERKSEFAPLSVNGAECTRALVKEGDVIAIGPYLARISHPQPAQAAPQGGGLRPTPEPAPVGAGLGEVDLPGAENTSPIEIPQAAPLAPQDGAIDFGQAGVVAGPAPTAAFIGAGVAGGAGGGDLGAPFGSAAFVAGGGVAPAGLTASSPVVMDSSQAYDGAAPRLPDESTRAEMADDDAATKLNAPTKLSVRLQLRAGSATDASGGAISELEIAKDETYLGRGKDCDLILNDKKSSRRNALIRRAGLSFTIKDLESANGTYVNGAKLAAGKERELLDDDVVRIGAVEIVFKVLSRDYLAKAAGLASLPGADDAGADGSNGPSSEELQVINGLDGVSLSAGGAMAAAGIGVIDNGYPSLGSHSADAGVELEGSAGIAGIAGIDPSASSGGQQSLLAKFKALPKQRQYVIGGLVAAILFLAFGMDEDSSPPITGKRTKVVQGEGKSKDKDAKDAKPVATLESLTPEQRKFVEQRYDQALTFFKGRDFDQAIATVDQILKVLPTYEPAREIERYSREAKRKQEAQLEEQRKREDEAKLKAKVQQLVDEAGARMAAKDYPVARELFGQILALDPDNQAVNAWRKDIEAYEERVKLERQQKDVEEQINKRAEEILSEGIALKKQGRYYGAIEIFEKIKDIGASDRGILKKAQALSKACRAAIAARREPLLSAAKAAEGAGELAKAVEIYRKAIAIDPNHPAAYAAVTRLKAAIHERAKAPYTEAILAESYSDFATARRKYQETIQLTPEDDEYHQRAVRRLRYYFRKEEAPQ